MKDQLLSILHLFFFILFQFIISIRCNDPISHREGGNLPSLNFGGAPVLSYQILARYPHDPRAFTEGLVYNPLDGYFFESTGLYGRSSLRRVNVTSGTILQDISLNSTYFGEGIAIVEEGERQKIFQLTWQEGVVFKYDLETFQLEEKYKNPMPQGWGLTTNGTYLMMSDGTSSIGFLDPGK